MWSRRLIVTAHTNTHTAATRLLKVSEKGVGDRCGGGPTKRRIIHG
jgi:hypothetical protein